MPTLNDHHCETQVGRTLVRYKYNILAHHHLRRHDLDLSRCILVLYGAEFYCTVLHDLFLKNFRRIFGTIKNGGGVVCTRAVLNDRRF